MASSEYLHWYIPQMVSIAIHFIQFSISQNCLGQTESWLTFGRLGLEHFVNVSIFRHCQFLIFFIFSIRQNWTWMKTTKDLSSFLKCACWLQNMRLRMFGLFEPMNWINLNLQYKLTIILLWYIVVIVVQMNLSIGLNEHVGVKK